MLAAFLVIAGILVLYFGAEVLVKGASQMALSFGITPLIVGLTVVSFSTSMPEAVSSLVAQLRGNGSEIAFGNVIGSNIANIGLILGLTALVHPLSFHSSILTRETLIMLASAGILIALLIFGGGFYLVHGVVLLLGLVAYVAYQIVMARQQKAAMEVDLTEMAHLPAEGRLPSAWWDILLVCIGVAFLLGGGYMLIEGAVALARLFGVSEWVIGLTIVAFGTSCPELATSLVAALRKQHDISLGNIVGSNVFNTFFVVGAVACVKPIEVTIQASWPDLVVMTLFSLALLAIVRTGHRMNRWEGGIIFAGYLAYVGWLFANHSHL